MHCCRRCDASPEPCMVGRRGDANLPSSAGPTISIANVASALPAVSQPRCCAKQAQCSRPRPSQRGRPVLAPRHALCRPPGSPPRPDLFQHATKPAGNAEVPGNETPRCGQGATPGRSTDAGVRHWSPKGSARFALPAAASFGNRRANRPMAAGFVNQTGREIRPRCRGNGIAG